MFPKNKTSLIIGIGLVLLGVYFLAKPPVSTNNLKSVPTATPSPSVIPTESVTLIINPGTGTPITIKTPASASQSAFSVLQQVTTDQKLEFSYKTYPFGKLVESITGLKNSAAMAWIYFVNGKSPNVGADQYLLKPEDVVEWKYQKPDF